MSTLSVVPDEPDPIAEARRLAEAGFPIFVAPPIKGFPGTEAEPVGEFRLPKGWQHTEADPSALDAWQPGWAVCLVTGVGSADVLDYDPRNAADGADPIEFLTGSGLMPRVFGRVATPGKGTHYFIAPTGQRKSTPLHGLDHQAGAPDGEGRGFVFLPGTTRRRYRGGWGDREYSWVEPIDVEALAEGSVDDEAFVSHLRSVAKVTDYEPSPAWPEGAKPDARETKYLEAALKGCCLTVAQAREGERNATLFVQTLKLASYVRGAGLGEARAKRNLLKAATEYAGLDKGEAVRTIRSAWAIAKPRAVPPAHETAKQGVVEPLALGDVRTVFRRWLGEKYDLQFLDTVLSVAAAGLHAEGDPAWVMFVGGSGVGKTETVASLEPAGCIVVSTIGGEPALLSGTPAKQRAKGATGGLLREIGAKGVLVIKDFTTILSMNRDDRTKVLAALREIADGRWTRTLGADGGMKLEWQGRATFIGATTSAYDEHHGVIASMGDRFLLCRLDSEDPDVRLHATMQALRNGGDEVTMRAELGAAVAGLMAGVTIPTEPLADELLDEIVALADLVARARSEVARDFKGEPQWAHAPEMPTRLAKQMQQAYRGARGIGLDDLGARRIVQRLAHDSLPPARRRVLLDVWDSPRSSVREVADRTGMSRTTCDRVLQELAMHGLVEVVPGSTPWQYVPKPGIAVDLDVLRVGYGTVPETYPPSPRGVDAS